jgi:hypothetical protein
MLTNLIIGELIDTNGCTELSEQKCEVVNVPELKVQTLNNR